MTQQTGTDPHHILVVDDDQRLRDLLKRFLSGAQFRVSTAADTQEADQLQQSLAFDLIVLDVMMPGENGRDYAIRLRKTGNQIPILMLTAMGEAADRIAGLNTGVDDYLNKPFEPEELTLRIRAILRRAATVDAAAAGHAAPTTDKKAPISLGQCRYDPTRQRLTKLDKPVKLTESEANLLTMLADRAPLPIPRSELAAQLGTGQDRSVDVQITRLRRKIEANTRDPQYLKTIRGLGYALLPDEPDAQHEQGEPDQGAQD